MFPGPVLLLVVRVTREHLVVQLRVIGHQRYQLLYRSLFLRLQRFASFYFYEKLGKRALFLCSSNGPEKSPCTSLEEGDAELVVLRY